jgi:hypothetical protein
MTALNSPDTLKWTLNELVNCSVINLKRSVVHNDSDSNHLRMILRIKEAT